MTEGLPPHPSTTATYRSGSVAFDMVVTQSPRMRTCVELARKAAASKLTVLITGETGTGKNIIAQAIHNASERSGGPFVAINCSALSETLLESELFGHEKGAFTGATDLRRGWFELASGPRISRFSRRYSSPSAAASSTRTSTGSRTRPRPACAATPGPATCASFAP